MSALKSLADARCHLDPLKIENCSTDLLLGQLSTMLTIRFVEERIAQLVLDGKAKCPCHLGIGQEAIAAGVSAGLRSTDRIFGTHRSHAHFLAAGGSLYELLAEVLGKASGCSRGMGGSMHLVDTANGFVGSVPIVGATIPMAIGAALAARKDGRGDVAIAYFGDGAAEEGVLHECLNMAAYYRLPMIFVCENNLFSSHLHISLRQPSDSIARFADAHCMPSHVIDGNDVVAVTKTAREAIDRARSGDGASFIEAVTYRWRGHVGPSEDIDVGVKRSEDLVLWKRRDPVSRLTRAMISARIITEEEITALEHELRARIEEAAQQADKAPYPPLEQLMDSVYASPSSTTSGPFSTASIRGEA